MTSPRRSNSPRPAPVHLAGRRASGGLQSARYPGLHPTARELLLRQQPRLPPDPLQSLPDSTVPPRQLGDIHRFRQGRIRHPLRAVVAQSRLGSPVIHPAQAATLATALADRRLASYRPAGRDSVAACGQALGAPLANTSGCLVSAVCGLRRAPACRAKPRYTFRQVGDSLTGRHKASLAPGQAVAEAAGQERAR